MRPVYEGNINGVYIRIGSSNRKADKDMINELRRYASNQTYDETLVYESSEKVIDQDALHKYLPKTKLIENKILENLRLLIRYQNKLVPTVGGILLLGKDKEKSFPDARIYCALFSGITKTNIDDQLIIEDYLPNCVERILEFIKKHSFLKSEISEIKRIDKWNVPLLALREAVINALVHSDYSQKALQ